MYGARLRLNMDLKRLCRNFIFPKIYLLCSIVNARAWRIYITLNCFCNQNGNFPIVFPRRPQERLWNSINCYIRWTSAWAMLSVTCLYSSMMNELNDINSWLPPSTAPFRSTNWRKFMIHVAQVRLKFYCQILRRFDWDLVQCACWVMSVLKSSSQMVFRRT